MNKIGIVGYGKMGRDIFRFYYSQCQNTSFVIFCRHSQAQYKAELDKELQKMLRRKRITEEIFEFQRENLRFTDNWNDFSDCDMIIESAAEDLEVKKSIFASIESVLDKECLLLTNTSSLSIEKIFEDTAHPDCCFGLHFFYPLKLTSFVELNLIPQNDTKAVERVKRWVESYGKRTLEFYQPFHMYLNQFIFTAISAAIYFRNESDCSVDLLEKAFHEFFPIGGIFGLIDSIGLGILTQNAGAFSMKRTENLHNYGIDMMKKWTSCGFPKEPNTFLAEIRKHEKNIPEKEINFPIECMIALLMNEAIFAAEECHIESELLMGALQDSIGIAVPFSEYYQKLTVDSLWNMSAKLHEYHPGFFPFPNEKNQWERYFHQ